MYPALHIRSFRAEEVVSDDGVVESDELGSVALVAGSAGQPFSVWASFTLGRLFSFMAIAAGELVAVLCSSSLASASASASTDLPVRIVNLAVFCWLRRLLKAGSTA